MRYPDQLLDDIRARLSVSQVVGRKVALKKAGREYRGLSPFKSEKTPSFYVNDQKGFYHCFSSSEHGDIFTFVMKTEGLTFTEAIERLAAEAGVPLPKAGPRDTAAEDRRKRLHALLDASQSFFQAQYLSPAGEEARRYIQQKRRLSDATVATFGIGFAPNSRTALKDHLLKLGYTFADMATAGMLISGEDIREPYDRFRNRVMFPILDLKGRVIAFGGRALEAGAPAKYLNSPETPLFHKGAILFNAARAKPLAFERHRVLVVEGYMDVVALTQAGFGEAVAPLGTALTEDQIHILWRMCKEPMLCFDGDKAGQKAAHRAVDTVLPNLRPGFSLSFAFLPDGLDPDDLVRQRGPDAMRAVLAKPKALADVLFEKETAGGDYSTPERRAALEQVLATQIKRIADDGVRAHYADAVKGRLDALWGRATSAPSPLAIAVAEPASHANPGRRQAPAYGDRSRGDRNRTAAADESTWLPPKSTRGAGNSGRGAARGGGSSPGRRWGQPQPPDPRTARSSSLKGSRLVAPPGFAPSTREALIVATVIRHPWLLDDQAEQFAALEMTSPDLSRLRDSVLTAHADIIDSARDLDSAQITAQLARLGVASPLALIDQCLTHRSDKFAASSADRPTVAAGWIDAIRLHRRTSELARELDAADRAFRESEEESDLERIRELHRELAILSEPDAVMS